ncbi:hypothetical protein N0V90_006760 [Kalmusia sp. IMI 367209]|nr:hypothetical protein N0V90_006760 [Kalmusia sp. IMI 367209]
MRVIQDSEDEDDLEMEDSGAAMPARDAPPEPVNKNNSPQLDEKGTGSTESLKRAIQAVHRAHFRDASSDHQDQSNPSGLPLDANATAQGNSQGAPDSSVSLPEHASKRRRMSLDANITLYSACDTLPITFGERHTGQADDNTNTHWEPAPEKLWELHGTMQEDWEHHEPLGLFPPMSSTIPNATATQQQLLAEVLAPEFLGVELESETSAPKYEPSKSSVPWSDYLKSSCKDFQGPSQSVEQQPQPSQSRTSDSAAFLTGNHLGGEALYEPSAPADLRLPSHAVKQSTPNEVNSDLDHDQNDLDSYAVSPNKAKQGHIPSSEDDPIAIDLPKEQYKPRPSRSRSLKLNIGDPIDYSVRPEKAAKKTRRTRTSGDVETGSTATTPEKVKQICDMGFTLMTTKKALRQHNGDVTHTVNWLIANAVAEEDELAPPRSSKPKNKRRSNRDQSMQDPPAEAPQTNLTRPIVDNSCALTNTYQPPIRKGVPEPEQTTTGVKSSTVVKVVIPATKRPTTPPKDEEQQAEKNALSQHIPEVTSDAEHKSIIDEAELSPRENQNATKQPPQGKKRGRGRPRKETKAIDTAEEEPFEQTSQKPEEAMIIEDGLSDRQTSKVQEPQTNSNPPNTTPEPFSEKKSKLTNDTPSATGSSRTPYRIGLSKRARIAPLLRTLKK